MNKNSFNIIGGDFNFISNSNDRLYIKSKSIFAPKHYKDLTPKGFKIFTFNSGFKKKKNDTHVGLPVPSTSAVLRTNALDTSWYLSK